MSSSSLARLEGRVAVAGELLTSKLGQVACVYWDVRDGLDADPREVGSSTFWLETQGERVLVLGDHLRVSARGERRREIVAVANADLEKIATRLAEVKEALRREAGPGARALHREREELATLATFLHATRAHARGKVHLAGSRAAQEKWIREHATLAEGGLAKETAALARNAWEVVIQPGQRVIVEGPTAVEPLPEGFGGAAGYRDAPRARVMRGSPGAPLELTSAGGADRRSPRALARRGDTKRPASALSTGAKLLAAGVALVVVLELAARCAH